MPGELYALTGPTKDRLSEVLRDYGRVGSAAIAGSVARGTTWVKVTGAISGGWYPGVVSIDQAGTFVDLTTPVNVQSVDGSILINGVRYLCTRTGDSSGQVAQFRTISPTGGAAALDRDSAQMSTNANFSGSTGGTFLSIAFPAQAVYLVSYTAFVLGQVTGSWAPSSTNIADVYIEPIFDGSVTYQGSYSLLGLSAPSLSKRNSVSATFIADIPYAGTMDLVLAFSGLPGGVSWNGAIVYDSYLALNHVTRIFWVKIADV